MESIPAIELNAFVPARDFKLSKQFYLDLGFTLLWGNNDIAQFKIGPCTFLLQNFHVKEHSENFMMALKVEDADIWWDHFKRIGLAEKYPGLMLKPPTLQPWGLRVLYLADPSGVLWHIQDTKKA